MTIIERIDDINSFLTSQRKQFSIVVSETDKLKNTYSLKEKQILKKYLNKRHDINQVYNEVLKFYRIAKDNTRDELVKRGKKPIAPDINLLSGMLYKIDENNYNDYTASKIVELVGNNIVFLENQINEIDGFEKEELGKLETELKNKLSDLKLKKHNILQSCDDYLSGQEVGNLRKLLDIINKEYGFDNHYAVRKKNGLNKTLLYGYQQRNLSIPSGLQQKAQKELGNNYRNNYIDCPCGFNFNKLTYIVAEYVPCIESEIQNGIKALVINVLLSVPVEYIRISIFDSIMYSANILGELSSLAGQQGGVIESVPKSEDDLKNKIKALSEYYRTVERKIGKNNVFDHNKKVSSTERIPLRLMIINREEKKYISTSSEMSYLLYNAHKLGIIVVELVCNRDGGSKSNSIDQNILTNINGEIRIVTDSDGRLYRFQDKAFYPFRWHQAPNRLSDEFISSLEGQIKLQKRDSDLFSYYPLKVPERSSGKRRPIIIPFARDDNDAIVSCTFENENFAAYIMGASRSGKSTLLHVMICSLIMNYHPDEVELWLVDFKKTEFRCYGDSCPPHLKYLLLEESEDLIFDLIDELTETLNERMRVFSDNGWSKLSEVPSKIYMPAIFIIIDEFAQVSQKLRDSQFSGETNYARKLENILAKGAAFGVKFIFASQSYNTGIEGLTQTARKQIQMRFALKNTSDEVKDTLNLNSYQIDERLMQLISSLRVYETLFKRIDNTGATIVDRYFNLKVEMSELKSAIEFLNSKLYPTDSLIERFSYINKNPVLLINDQPLTFKSLVPKYISFEKNISNSRTYRDVDLDDVFIYLGVPCSFKLVKPILFKKMASQNLLLVGGEIDTQACILLSIINSWRKIDTKLSNFEIWAHEQYPTFKRYKDRWQQAKCESDIRKITERTEKLIDNLSNSITTNKLIVCMGLDFLYDDFDDYINLSNLRKTSKGSNPSENSGIDLWSLMNSTDVTQEQIKTYNNTTDSNNTEHDVHEVIGDLRKNMNLLLSMASKKGIHFVFLFTHHQNYRATKIRASDCQHKVLFPMSRTESKDIANIDTSDLGNGIFVYSDGYKNFYMRPHIYRGVPCNGWIFDNGTIIKL